MQKLIKQEGVSVECQPTTCREMNGLHSEQA